MLAAAAALSIAATGFALARGTQDVSQESIPALLTKEAAGAGRYLAVGSTPSASLLRYQVVLPALRDLAGRSGRPDAVAVLDRRGRLLAADSCATPTAASACEQKALALLQPLLADRQTQHLLAGATGRTPISGAVAGRSFGAAAILASGKQATGILLAVFAGPLPPAPHESPLGHFWSEWTASLPQDWLWLVALSIVLGTAVGALLSHRLVRRVTGIADIAHIWSQGDLTPTADTRRHDELGRLAADLNQMADQLRNLLDARSELATQQERRRVQRDLHDGIKQELFATAMQLATARAATPAGADTLAVALDHARAACRRAQHELAALLEQTPLQNDLAAALTELAARTERETRLRVAHEIEPVPRLPEAVQDAIYRIAQEALSNAHRHADATAIELRLLRNGATTSLHISDDGRGFDPVQYSSGMGLQTMRERAESLGGHLSIQSSPSGTTIDATFSTAAP